MLTKSVPANRQGNNNVSILCVPNPPLNEKCPEDKTPVCMLVRVKTAAAADELLEQLNSHKNWHLRRDAAHINNICSLPGTSRELASVARTVLLFDSLWFRWPQLRVSVMRAFAVVTCSFCMSCRVAFTALTWSCDSNKHVLINASSRQIIEHCLSKMWILRDEMWAVGSGFRCPWRRHLAGRNTCWIARKETKLNRCLLKRHYDSIEFLVSDIQSRD